MISIDKQKCRRCIFVAAVLVVIIVFFASVWPLLTPFFLAAVLAYLTAPAVGKMNDLGVPLCLSLTVIIIYLLLALYVLLVISFPMIMQQLRNLLDYLPGFIDTITAAGSNMLSGLSDAGIAAGLEQGLHDISAALEEKLTESGKGLADMVIGIPEAVIYTVLAPIVGYYFLRDREKIKNKFLLLAAPGRKKEFLRLAGELNDLARGFVRGYLSVALIMAVLSSMFYYAMGLDYALVLGLLMGIADLVPYFGPILGAIPAVLVALTESGTKAGIVIIGLLVLQQAESSVITPRIMGNRVGLHPVTTIFAVLAGGYLGGLGGAILAVPAAAAVLLIGKYVFGCVFADNQLRNRSVCDKIQK